MPHKRSKTDFPTFRYWLTEEEGHTTTASSLTTPVNVFGGSFDGSADLNHVIAPAYGGTGNAFAKLTGPSTTEKTFTLPNTDATILTDASLITPTQGGTGVNTYTTGDLLVAINPSNLTRLPDVVAGNALISGGVSMTPTWGKIDLDAHTTGTLPPSKGGLGTNGFIKFTGPSTTEKTFTLPNTDATILTTSSPVTVEQGGTNSTLPLNNNRVLISTAGSIKESPALSDGQILIGGNGVAPSPGNITSGYGITITNSAGSITTSLNQSVSQAFSVTDATTTSLTDVVLTGMTLTPGVGDYLVFFSGVVSNTNADKQGTISLYVNGSQLTYTVRQELAQADRRVHIGTMGLITNLLAGQTIDVRWNVIANTGTFYQRTLIALRIK